MSATAPAVAVFGNDPRGLLALALCLGALFLLHQHRARLGEVPMAVTVTKPVAEQRTSPPARDPLGAAPCSTASARG